MGAGLTFQVRLVRAEVYGGKYLRGIPVEQKLSTLQGREMRAGDVQRFGGERIEDTVDRVRDLTEQGPIASLLRRAFRQFYVCR